MQQTKILYQQYPLGLQYSSIENVKFFILSMALSTCIRRDAILLVETSSFSDSWLLPFKNATSQECYIQAHIATDHDIHVHANSLFWFCCFNKVRELCALIQTHLI